MTDTVRTAVLKTPEKYQMNPQDVLFDTSSGNEKVREVKNMKVPPELYDFLEKEVGKSHRQYENPEDRKAIELEM